MRKLLFLVLVMISICSTYAQKEIKVEGTDKYSFSQKYGMTETDGDYTLTVSFDDSNLKFKTADAQNMTSYSVAKKTDKYIIGKNQEGNYSFFDIKKKQFYYIDYYKNRYMTAGYGAQSSEIKQTVTKMMELLKKGHSQKDLIQHLIEQTKYDF